METIFFNISSAFMLLLLVITACYKKINPAAIITGAVSVGYSVIFDIVFGDRFGLYYYISPAKSTLYIVLSAVLAYLSANVIYLVFSPRSLGKLIIYTAVWIAGMLAWEYMSLAARTIVLTGWRILPWSAVTYISTYLWMNALYRYLSDRIHIPGTA